MQQTKIETFEKLKEDLKNTSEINFLMKGADFEPSLTLKNYLPFLVRMRTVKGQNVNSIFTEQEILEMGYEKIYDGAFAFYNEDGEKCYDLAFMPSQDNNLKFENTLEQNNASIEKDDFNKMRYSLEKVFGVTLDVTGEKKNYHPSILRTLGRKVINFFRRSNSLHKENGILYLEKPNFQAKEGTSERKIEENIFYRNSLVHYLDHVGSKISNIDYSKYQELLLQSNTFNNLTDKEKEEQLKKHYKVFEENKELINRIFKDLIFSEIVKSMPSLNAQTRYELNQAYILRVAQNIASLPDEISKDPIMLKLIATSVKQPILTFNQSCNYTPEEVKKLYGHLNQNSIGDSIESIIFGDCEQPFVENFNFNFLKNINPHINKDAALLLNEQPLNINDNEASEGKIDDSKEDDLGTTQHELIDKKNKTNESINQNNKLSHFQTTLDKFVDEEKGSGEPIIINGVVKNQPETHLSGVTTERKISNYKTFNSLSKEEVKKRVENYLMKKTEKVLKESSLTYDKNETRENILSYSYISNLYFGLINRTTKDKTIKIMENELQCKNFGNETKIVKTIKLKVDTIANQIMQDWENRKNENFDESYISEWEQQRTINKFLDCWYNNINKHDFYKNSENTNESTRFYEAYKGLMIKIFKDEVKNVPSLENNGLTFRG